jgi:hypothetical protein
MYGIVNKCYRTLNTGRHCNTLRQLPLLKNWNNVSHANNVTTFHELESHHQFPTQFHTAHLAQWRTLVTQSTAYHRVTFLSTMFTCNYWNSQCILEIIEYYYIVLTLFLKKLKNLTLFCFIYSILHSVTGCTGAMLFWNLLESSHQPVPDQNYNLIRALCEEGTLHFILKVVWSFER